ncbi:MAG: sugar ABC transporter substrate-binding protein, partial [Chloroflexota bacterium]|nr:sugar ABC transporter substrate-binding protein [Chloroflexota bacterium]
AGLSATGAGLLAVLAGCGAPTGTGGDAGTAAKGPSGQLTWFMRAQSAELPWEQAAVTMFKEQAPNVTVTLETVPSAGEFDSKLTSLLAGGTPPDVWTHWGQSGFGDYLAKGLLADLSSFAARDRVDGSTFLPNTFDAWKRNGKLYGLSFNQRFGSFIFYNKQMFDGAGVALPPVDWEDKSWTWDRMADSARRLTGASGGSQTFGIGAGAQPGLWGLAYLFGGDFFTKEHYANGIARQSNISTPEVQAAMSARADLMHKLRAYPTPADLSAIGSTGLTPLFIAGGLGMLFDTGSEWPRIDKEAKFEWGVAAAPRQRDNKVVNFINPLLLGADSKNKEAAWAFMKWHVGEAGQRVLVQNSFQPVHKALLDEWLKGGTFKQSAADVKRVVEGAAPHSQISPNQLLVEFGPIRTAVDEAMAATWRGERSAADGLREAKTKVDAVLTETYTRYGGK